MKRGIIFIFTIIMIILVGCGMQSNSKAGKQELENSRIRGEANAAEKKYIEQTHESVEKINNGVADLKVKLSNINFDDPYWVGKVRMDLNHIRFAVDDYLKAENILSAYKENFSKYNKTRKTLDNGISEFQVIIKDTDEALDTANHEKIQSINSRLESANEIIKSGLGQQESNQ